MLECKPEKSWGFSYVGYSYLQPWLLGGSWVVVSRVKSRITILITHIRGLITPLINTHEPHKYLTWKSYLLTLSLCRSPSEPSISLEEAQNLGTLTPGHDRKPEYRGLT